MKKAIFILSLVFLFAVSGLTVNAQCSVCRASAESNVAQGHKVGRGLNKGILYLMSIPYLIGGAAWYVWHKNKEVIFFCNCNNFFNGASQSSK